MGVDAEVIIVGAGLAGLVAATELAGAGRRVTVLDQEPEASFGGQAFWSFGGLETDLQGRVLRADGQPLPGLYAAGEAAGFGGGGMHGYRALEGTFLGGCLFSGRVAGRSAAVAVSGGSAT
jgi:predicted oxidoreductase